jgi:hypothetical protein
MATVAAVVVAAAAALPEWGFIILTHAPRNLRTVTKLDVPRLAAVGGGGAAARPHATLILWCLGEAPLDLDQSIQSPISNRKSILSGGASARQRRRA